MTTIIDLPFPGFYESIYSGEVDDIGEREVEHFVDERQKEDGVPKELRLDASEVAEFLFDCTDYRACYLAIAKSYVDAFDDVISEHLEIKLGLKFESMSSPREYNFTTDRVFAHIEDATVAALFELSASDDHETLSRVIHERFTSYDGFCSSYENGLDYWLEKPLDEWDHNELGTLLLAAMEIKGVTKDESYYDVYYRVVDCDGVYHEWSNAVDWPRFEEKVAELREEKRAEFASENPDEPMPEPRCNLTLNLPL